MTTLLLLHPLGSDGGFWADVAPALERATSAPDLPGHGTAPPPASATLAAYTDVALARARTVDGPVVAVGISLGGLVAQDLLRREPGLLAGLVLVDTVAHYVPPLLDTWPERARTAREQGLEPLVDAMTSMWFSPGFRERRPAVVREVRETFLAMSPEGYARTCEALHGADVRGVLSPDVPTLVVCGEADAPPFVAAAPVLAAEAGGEPVWLTGAQHASVLEQPDDFARAVRDFLERHDL